MADWPKIKAEYIRGGIGTRKLAEKYGVSLTTLKKKCASEGWVKLRIQKEAKRTARVVDACATKEANEAIKIYEAADKAVEIILKKLSGNLTPQDVRHLTGSLKDIAAVKGLQTEAEKREQEARIAKLRREAEGRAEGDGEISIKICGISTEEAEAIVG